MESTSATIFALSSGRPPAAIAVVRVSGPRAGFGLESLIGRVPSPRQATLARVRDPATGETIDQALALWFPAPRSETGEDVAELQLHGGQAVIAAVLAALGRLDGFRLAEPGEFTRRAFENGQLDLTQVEGLGDLIAAQTQAQRRQAFHQLRGLLGEQAERWRARSIEACALVEAGIDFSDEGDVPTTMIAQAMAAVRPLADEIAHALASATRGERLREGLWVAIAGAPNAGKSTLLNRIARREAAIVSPVAGTTRDVIEVHLDLGGYPMNVLDTAGIRPAAEDLVEREGMRRARAAAAGADLVLWIVDATDRASLAAAKDEPVATGTTRWIVLNKIDLLPEVTRHEGSTTSIPQFGEFPGNITHHISAVTGAGLTALIAALENFAATFFTAEPALVTRQRQQTTLRQVQAALADAMQLAEAGAGEELVAEQLRHAATGLGKITGRVDVEDILDVIFREFCIGK